MPTRSQFAKRPGPTTNSRRITASRKPLKDFRIEIPDWKPGPIGLFFLAAVFILGVKFGLPAFQDNLDEFENEQRIQKQNQTLQ